MLYTMTYFAEENFVEIHLEGDLDETSFKNAIAGVAEYLKDKDCYRLISDYRNASFNLKILETYTLPQSVQEIASEAGLVVQRYKRAIVVKQTTEALSFFETVSVNRGQTIKIFFDYDEAKRWLLRD